jgi:NOL1/NOP2/fmu family ribosome biogenesis protein
MRKPEEQVLIWHQDVLHVLGSQWTDEQRSLSDALRVIAPGTPFAERKGNEWRPHAASALSDRLQRTVFPEVELDEAAAIRYLQGHAITGTDARGTALITYKGHPLGWVQGAGARWNNRWPQAWRIRAQQPGAPRVSWAEA